MPAKAAFPDPETVKSALGSRSIVLVGLMGAGKTSVGRRLAQSLDLPFVDADQEIEAAAGCSIEDFFELYGEPAFREGEERVIERLLNGGPQILSTGGGAFMSPVTRDHIAKKGLSVWLKADLETLMKRTARRNDRPLLKDGDPESTLRRLIDERYPVYAEADITVESSTESVEASAKLAIRAIDDYLDGVSATPSDHQ